MLVCFFASIYRNSGIPEFGIPNSEYRILITRRLHVGVFFFFFFKFVNDKFRGIYKNGNRSNSEFGIPNSEFGIPEFRNSGIPNSGHKKIFFEMSKLTPPFRYSMVEFDLYRSAYPTALVCKTHMFP